MKVRPHGTRRRRMRREVKWTLTAVVTILVVEVFVLPRLGGGRKSLHLLSHFNIAFALTGLVIEAAALVAFAQLTYAVLPTGILPRSRILQIDLSTLAVSHVMPGGTAFGAALMYRLMTQEEVRAADAGFAIAMQGVGSAVVLNVIFWIALVISLFFHAYNPLYAVAAVLGILLMASFAGVVILLTKGRVHVLDFLGRWADRVPFVDGNRLVVGVQHFADRLHLFARQKAQVRQAVGWASANWLLDAACLWVFIAAFHVYVPPVDLLVAYGLANILAVIPITPGGLGIVEAVLITTLHGFGVPLGVASLAVVGYRLVNFWLPIPIGGLAYLSLRFSGVGWRDRLRQVRNEVSQGAPGAETAPGPVDETDTATAGATEPDEQGAAAPEPTERVPTEREPTEREPTEREPVEQEPVEQEPVAAEPAGLSRSSATAGPVTNPPRWWHRSRQTTTPPPVGP